MYLNEQEKDLFFKLFFDLLYCVNKEHKIVSGFAAKRYPKSVDTTQAYQIKTELFENPSWIDEYLKKYGADRTEEEREIITLWRDNFVNGEFYVMRYLKNYSVFMKPGDEHSTRLYGITGLNHHSRRR